MTREEIFSAIREIAGDEGVEDRLVIEDSRYKEGTIYNDDGFLNICEHKTIAFNDISSVRCISHKGDKNLLLHLVIRAMFSSLKLEALIDRHFEAEFHLSFEENGEVYQLNDNKSICLYLSDYHHKREQLDFVDWQLIKMPNLLTKGLEEDTIAAWDRKALGTIDANTGWFRKEILFSYSEIAFTCNDEELYGCFKKETAIRMLVEEECVEEFLNWFLEENSDILSEQESYELIAVFMSEIDDLKGVYSDRTIMLS